MRDLLGRLRRLEIRFRPAAREPTTKELCRYIIEMTTAIITDKEFPYVPEDVELWFEETGRNEEARRNSITNEQFVEQMNSAVAWICEEYENEKFVQDAIAELNLWNDKKANESEAAQICESVPQK